MQDLSEFTVNCLNFDTKNEISACLTKILRFVIIALTFTRNGVSGGQ